jgi:hypothetical protein
MGFFETFVKFWEYSVLGLFTAIGLIGAIVQVSLLNAGGPKYVRPYVSGLWLSVSMAYIAIQGFGQLVRRTPPPCCCCDCCATCKWRRFFFCAMPPLAFLLMIGYFVGYRCVPQPQPRAHRPLRQMSFLQAKARNAPAETPTPCP